MLIALSSSSFYWTTLLGSMPHDAETINFDTFYAVKVDMNGTTIKEFIDGSEILSATSSTLSAAGDGGLMLSVGDDDRYWDDFLSEDDSAGGATIPTLDEGMLVGGMQPMGGGLD